MSFGITELMIILVIVLLLFGTKKLRSIGTDLGGAIKGFSSQKPWNLGVTVSTKGHLERPNSGCAAVGTV